MLCSLMKVSEESKGGPSKEGNSSETSVSFCHTTCRHFPYDINSTFMPIKQTYVWILMGFVMNCGKKKLRAILTELQTTGYF